MKKQKPDVVQEAKSSHGGSGGAHSLHRPAVTVLHIDDDSNDTELLRAATRKARLDVVVHNVEDGASAKAYLSGTGAYADRENYPLPKLILLDLKLPHASGFEILTWIRDRSELKRIPVVVLSGSQSEDDMELACQMGASSYIEKPLSFQALVHVVKDIGTAWLTGA